MERMFLLETATGVPVGPIVRPVKGDGSSPLRRIEARR
jgi:hypothetical protein